MLEIVDKFPAQVRVADMKHGQLFRFGKSIWMRTNASGTEAVDLGDGCHGAFGPTDTAVPVRARLEVLPS